MTKTSNETRFFNITREQLEAFQEDAKTFGLTKTPLEDPCEAECENISNRLAFLGKNFSNVKPFVFSGLPGVGKSTLTYMMHRATDRKIISGDLVIEMENAKICKEKGYAKKSEVEKEKGGRDGYVKWKEEITISCIEEACRHPGEVILELGAQSFVVMPRVVAYLKEHEVTNVLLDMDPKTWLANRDSLKEGRSNFSAAFKEGPEKYEAFCKKMMGDRLPVYQKNADVTVTREKGQEPIETLRAVLRTLSREQTKQAEQAR